MSLRASFLFAFSLLISISLLGCGGGSDSDSPPLTTPPPTTTPPVTHIAPVVELKRQYQILQGTESSITANVTYAGELNSINWRQFSGPELNLSDANSLTLKLNSSVLPKTDFASLQLELIDAQGTSSTHDVMLILSEVLPEQVVLASLPESPIEEGVEILQGQDAKGNEINLVTYQSLQLAAPIINEGIDLGVPDKYEQITNKFIDIQYPAETAEEKHEVRIIPLERFDIIWQYNEEDESVRRIPFFIDEDGTVTFSTKPENGRVTFSMLKINEGEE
jgi:hypothetical protein